MENGESSLERKFAGLGVSDPINVNGHVNGNDGLHQVMKAVEAAEATIKNQVEENNILRSELQKKNEELEKYKSGNVKFRTRLAMDRWNERSNEPYNADQTLTGLGKQIDSMENIDISARARHDLTSTVAFQNDLMRNDSDHAIDSERKTFLDDDDGNGSFKVNQGKQVAFGNPGFSQPAPITPFFPSRSVLENDSDSQLRISGRGFIPIDGVDNSEGLNQDLVVKNREHEEEIAQLKKHLREYSIKEAQIYSDKYVLEKRLSYMRMAFDQQQQDLVDAASKAISYRQEIMEENVRLTYALQAAQQERSTFISSLMPLLAEYSLQPPVADAQSIVSSVKVLFRHLQEQLLSTEGKLRDSQYQLAPWSSDANPTNFSQLPFSRIEIKEGMELVPQPVYSNGQMQSSGYQTPTDGDLLDQRESGIHDVSNLEHDGLGNYSHPASRKQEIHPQLVTQTESHPTRNNDEVGSKKVTFGGLLSSDMDEPDSGGYYDDREPSTNWPSKTSGYPMNPDDPGASYSTYLPPVLEEPSSSFSEAADDDPPPAIDGLQISGEAFPGTQLQACGFSINGTTSCNFEWVRHSEDGSFNYIEGAKQPIYLVTADDIDMYLAIEVTPLDDRKRKGELVKVFANEHRKITCDPEMQAIIEKTLYSGSFSYKLSLWTGFLDIWEPATLAIKRDGYTIKCIGPSGVFVSEKFTPSTTVSIPNGSLSEFSIVDSQDSERILKVDENSDINGSRDTIVLTLRLFILKASEKKKGKRRGLFFK